MSAGTPLPWTVSGAGVMAGDDLIACTGSDPMPYHDETAQLANAAYIVHACNAYPKLVSDRARLVEALQRIVAGDGPHGTFSGSQCVEIASALLADLDASGEA